ncbi:MAG: DUF1707 domain-containing protein [Solirubrobacterales bacterium]|nr:DUF1707 domain-containing protein [Solirubrobacterales bacterium]
MSDPYSLRVSDEQRERAAQQIREHFAAGRLTEDELNERVQATVRAQTEEELRAVLADLPALPPTPQEVKAELAHRRSHLQRRLLQESGGGVVLFLICTAIWVASGANGQFWPIWVALVALIPLIRNGWRLYGPAPEFDQVERELAQKNALRSAHRAGGAQRAEQYAERYGERHARRAERYARRHRPR